MSIGLLGVALFVAAVRRRDTRLVWAAAMTVAAASLLREHMLYISFAAAAGSALAAARGRRLACCGTVAGFHRHLHRHLRDALHRRRRPHLANFETTGCALRGGLEHLFATLTFSQELFAAKSWFLPLLVGLSIGGALALWRTRFRAIAIFAAIAIGGMLTLFLIAGNGGRNSGTGQIVGYWGALVVPLALAFMPASFLSVDPGLQSDRWLDPSTTPMPRESAFDPYEGRLWSSPCPCTWCSFCRSSLAG